MLGLLHSPCPCNFARLLGVLLRLSGGDCSHRRCRRRCRNPCHINHHVLQLPVISPALGPGVLSCRPRCPRERRRARNVIQGPRLLGLSRRHTNPLAPALVPHAPPIEVIPLVEAGALEVGHLRCVVAPGGVVVKPVVALPLVVKIAWIALRPVIGRAQHLGTIITTARAWPLEAGDLGGEEPPAHVALLADPLPRHLRLALGAAVEPLTRASHWVVFCASQPAAAEETVIGLQGAPCDVGEDERSREGCLEHLPRLGLGTRCNLELQPELPGTHLEHPAVGIRRIDDGHDLTQVREVPGVDEVVAKRCVGIFAHLANRRPVEIQLPLVPGQRRGTCIYLTAPADPLGRPTHVHELIPLAGVDGRLEPPVLGNVCSTPVGGHLQADFKKTLAIPCLSLPCLPSHPNAVDEHQQVRAGILVGILLNRCAV
mmetsp:Transcript_49692/g.158693  ORF Transcript_49692/g.158693 Transcript_49692/m.158693 type:complete len:429 (+) Transcript_49692:133-1419(+)